MSSETERGGGGGKASLMTEVLDYITRHVTSRHIYAVLHFISIYLYLTLTFQLPLQHHPSLLSSASLPFPVTSHHLCTTPSHHITSHQLTYNLACLLTPIYFYSLFFATISLYRSLPHVFPNNFAKNRDLLN